MYVELFEKSITRLIMINYDNTGKLVKSSPVCNMETVDAVDVLKYFNTETHENKKQIMHYKEGVENRIISARHGLPQKFQKYEDCKRIKA